MNRLTLPRPLRIAVVPLLFLSVGFVAGTQVGSERLSHAEVRKTPQRRAFESGSERNEKILREILAELRQIDSRIENLEESVSTIARNTRD